MTKKIVALALAMILFISCLPLSIFAAEASADDSITATLIYVESTYSRPGEYVDVNVNIMNNPGIAGAKFSLAFDENLTLVSIEADTGVFNALDFTAPEILSGTIIFTWDSLDKVSYTDGTILTLKFKVAENTPANEYLDIDISHNYGDIYNTELESLTVVTAGGRLLVIDYIPGDANGDGVINGKDVTTIRRYNAGLTVDINLAAADVNDDGVINGKDVTLIRRVNASWPNVELLPGTQVCNHALTKVTAKEASCSAEGNTAYWSCTKCDKYFSDENATIEISLEDTIIPKKEHTVVVDEAIDPTYTTTGLTEGAHCSVCEEVLIEQHEIPLLNKNDIIYGNLKGADYPALTWYDEKVGVAEEDMPQPSREGYDFDGWYTSAEFLAGTKMTSIPAGTTGTVRLYAKWNIIEYNIIYDGVKDFDNGIPTYTIESRDIYLTQKPTWKHLIFTGWEDSDGKLVYKNNTPVIESGTTGDIYLKATWKQRQNIFVLPETTYSNAAFNEEDGTYYFFYHLGNVTNVLLGPKEGNGRDHSGIQTTLTTSKTVSVSESTATTTATAISKATKVSVEKTMAADITSSLSTTLGASATAGASVDSGFAKANASATVSQEITAGVEFGASVGSSTSQDDESSQTNETSSTISYMKESTFTEEESITLTADDPAGKYYFLPAGTFEVYSVVVYDPVKNTLKYDLYSKHIDTYPMILYSPDATEVTINPEIEGIPYEVYEGNIEKTILNSLFVFFDKGQEDVVVDYEKAKVAEVFSIDSSDNLPSNNFYSRSGYSFNGWELRDGAGNVLAEHLDDTTAVSTLAGYAENNNCRILKLIPKWDINTYTINYDANEDHYSIVVKRTASPNGKASIGPLNNGDTIYYGDELEVTYTNNTGYNITTNGKVSFTVTGNVTSDDIYAIATAKTYTIKYHSNDGRGDVFSNYATYNANYTLSSSPFIRDGYAFVGWSLNPSSIVADTIDGVEFKPGNTLSFVYDDEDGVFDLYAIWVKAKSVQGKYGINQWAGNDEEYIYNLTIDLPVSNLTMNKYTQLKLTINFQGKDAEGLWNNDNDPYIKFRLNGVEIFREEIAGFSSEDYDNSGTRSLTKTISLNNVGAGVIELEFDSHNDPYRLNYVEIVMEAIK